MNKGNWLFFDLYEKNLTFFLTRGRRFGNITEHGAESGVRDL